MTRRRDIHTVRTGTPTPIPGASRYQVSTARSAGPITATLESPDARLRSHALVLGRLLRRPTPTVARWRAPGFARQVDLVRAHLRVIHSHEALALSYSREHFHVEPVGARPPRPISLLRRSATDVAYAYRWMELAEGHQGGPWLAVVDAGAGMSDAGAGMSDAGAGVSTSA